MASKRTPLIDTKSVEGAQHGIDDNVSSIVYSPEELETMRQVKKRLEEEDKLTFVNLRFLAYLVAIRKTDVDEATIKFRRYLEAIAPFDMSIVESDEDLWDDPLVEQYLKDFYVPCGRDYHGGQIMWKRCNRPTLDSEEKTSIRASILYHIAAHADPVSFREGITYVTDMSWMYGIIFDDDDNDIFGYDAAKRLKSSRNAAKLKTVAKFLEFRTQVVLIVGMPLEMRIMLNAFISIFSCCAKLSSLKQVKLVTREGAMQCVPKESGPMYLGGGSGGITDVVEWTKRRYYQMPIPDLEETINLHDFA